MKKFTTILLIAFPILCLAQDVTKDSTKVKVETNFYIGVSFNTNQSLNLNKKLRNSNLPEMQDMVSELTTGLNFMSRKYSGDLEFGFSWSEKEKAENTLKYMGFNGRGRFHYNAIHKPKVTLAGGLSIAYQTNRYDIYSNDNSTDLNNLVPESNSGHVNLENRMFFAGPSTSLYLFKQSWFKLRLNMGYEFALTRGKYRSEYGSITNNIKENGNNRFVFGIAFL